MNLRGPDRREGPRRAAERTAHYTGEGVLAKALIWRQLGDSEADAGERIRITRELRSAIDDYAEALERCRETGTTTAEWIAMAGVALLVVLPTSVLGVGTWGRFAAVITGLVACAVLLWRGERGRP